MELTLHTLQQAAAQAIKASYDLDIAPDSLAIQETRKEFAGDYTLVVFPLTRHRLGAPPQIGQTLGQWMKNHLDLIEDFNVVKGFLNLQLSDAYWQQFLTYHSQQDLLFRTEVGKGQKVVVEFCSPNTNKPLHLGHLRNLVLGDAVSKILQANGYTVHPTCLFNDRGSNISKSMVAWQLAGKQDSPASTGKKGDKFVGDYYVQFAQRLRDQVQQLIEEGMEPKAAEKAAKIMQAVHEMTLQWEANDPAVRALWKQMNGWVYDSFHQTFARLGVEFEQFYYESEVYQRGKETVQEGLEKGIFYSTDDGAVVVDLEEEGLDKKLLLRSNGTTLYITQDLAIAEDKYREFGMDKSIYVVGNEQDYHFKVLFTILQKLGKPYGEGLFHLSYGMVDLPSGKMKSREGTTVDADDLMDEMIAKAREESMQNPDKIDALDEAQRQQLFETLGIGALKFYLAKVDPKKRMLFDPEESIDLRGHTGPFIQYAYTRTQAIARKAQGMDLASDSHGALEEGLLDSEKSVLRIVARYPEMLQEAGQAYNPALVANYAYELAKEYNRFYHEAPILKSDKPHTSAFRFALSNLAGNTLKKAMELLGIQVPDRM